MVLKDVVVALLRLLKNRDTNDCYEVEAISASECNCCEGVIVEWKDEQGGHRVKVMSAGEVIDLLDRDWSRLPQKSW
jgi:hypothetical protein